MFENIACLILAAGKGTRMYSEDPKVLRPLLGHPMLYYVYRALEPIFGEDILTVVGFGRERMEKAFPEKIDRFVMQEKQLGTGHAFSCSFDALKATGAEYCLVMNGDTPLALTETLEDFLDDTMASQADIAFLSLTLDDPGAYGRVIRGKNDSVQAIIELKDYDVHVHGPETGEINSGIYLLRLDAVAPLLKELSNENKSGEYYITDLIGLGVKHGLRVDGIACGSDEFLLGVNSPRELLEAELVLQQFINETLVDKGVILRNPGQVRIGPDVIVAPGVDITGPCEIYGTTEIRQGAIVESNVVILDSLLDKRSHVRSFSHLEKAVLGESAVAGPFARLRPGAVLKENVRVGNFVEVKKSVLAKGVKAGHLTYLGDADIGENTNIGAGTITCNYDGKNKHKTIIGKEAFIGSNTAFVAPVKIGDQTLVGAGSVITKDVDAHALAVGRSRQVNLKRRKCNDESGPS
ncbi:bifunctional UDP-N-acetylglucosamine diphosphorylase/glucosamine-1-phosphate N-acetyltransferase GlmU [Desulfovibrio inopinatus]|uniref:bifunctional UDP-N-acetylglucosamine diphosphorylase/glucosamine-1-phosphate N-acetyltransferase GlmU n=1 Tax=Desulfovibrio inopinatus TaxID=102109 RepID=UPI000482E48E|nr:bifunctional UDP-N-acetylglucosamine diphosphorylase/glucosamine-1-phosphate N-acetyltransferase GlmU [Desulfovibrio inopinatus]